MRDLKSEIAIKKHLIKKGMGLKTLSENSQNSHISIIKLAYLLYFPFSRIKLTQALKICSALDISISQLF